MKAARILFRLALAFTAQAPVAMAAQPKLTAEQAREDLDALERTLRSAHYDMYVHRSRAEYDAAFREARARLTGPKTSLDLIREFQPLVASGRVGHARIEFPVADYITAAHNGGTVLPFDIRIEDERVFVTHSYLPGSSIAPGAELLGMDGEPARSLVDQVSRFVSGERPYLVNAQLERFFPRWLWLMRGDIRDMEVRGIGADGKPFLTRIRGLPIGEAESQKSAWTEVLSTREVRIIDGQTAYLRPGPFYHDGGGDSMDLGTFRQFIDGAFARILEANPERLLIDLRSNPGGDNSFSDLMVSWFADRPFRFSDDFSIKASPETRRQFRQVLAGGKDQTGIVGRMSSLIDKRKDGAVVQVELEKALPRPTRFTGKVYVLVDRHSYSNAASAAAMIQDYGFGRIVGEETADLPTSYASSAQFTLPHSGISVTYPKGYFVRPNKDKSLRGVVPDLPIAPEVFRQGPDAVLQAALALVRQDKTGDWPQPSA